MWGGVLGAAYGFGVVVGLIPCVAEVQGHINWRGIDAIAVVQSVVSGVSIAEGVGVFYSPIDIDRMRSGKYISDVVRRKRSVVIHKSIDNAVRSDGASVYSLDNTGHGDGVFVLPFQQSYLSPMDYVISGSLAGIFNKQEAARFVVSRGMRGNFGGPVEERGAFEENISAQLAAVRLRLVPDGLLGRLGSSFSRYGRAGREDQGDNYRRDANRTDDELPKRPPSLADSGPNTTSLLAILSVFAGGGLVAGWLINTGIWKRRNWCLWAAGGLYLLICIAALGVAFAYYP